MLDAKTASRPTATVLILAALLGPWGASAFAGDPALAWYRMRSPGPAGHDVEQASGLCYGSIGQRDGLWTVCDRNGGQSAGRIYRFSTRTLEAAGKPGGTLTAEEEFVITPPRLGWSAFRQTHAMLGTAVLDHIQERVEAGSDAKAGRQLDLEAVTIAPALAAPGREHLFVVAEEPYSLVLELDLDERPSSRSHQAGTSPSRAVLVAAYRYLEDDQDSGMDANDGLEGLAYAGSKGKFWWAEEGTRLHKPDAHPRLFFSNPRIGLAELVDGEIRLDDVICERLTDVVRREKDGDAQTLNALCATADGGLLAVDRNGGWILRIDPRDMTRSRWINLYNIEGQNLREVLASFPGERRMPYVSIEGIAADGDGGVWLVDDPAMPESFRASCLVRVSGVMSRASLGEPVKAVESRPMR